MSIRRPVSRAPEAPPRPEGRGRGAHHAPGGGFRDPWPPHPEEERTGGAFLRWRLERLRSPLPPDPAPEAVPREAPDPARHRGATHEVRLTWIGHATFLLQIHGLNLLTDPVLGRRASPFRRWGPSRFTPPALAVAELPPLDAVLLSHDHYDHLDRWTVDRLKERFGPGLAWITPLGYRSWLRRRGVPAVTELDWWEETGLEGSGEGVRVICLPARHWTRRGWRTNRRLWSSWAVLEPGGEGPRGVYFAGDSGWCPVFREVGERLGPFRASILPIGAYEPRWFMAPAHMNPEEAVRTYLNLGGRGAFVGMHWGTFRLTDEDPLEPPERTREAWARAQLPPEDLKLPGIGGTVVL